jgi:glycosidase
VVSTRTAASTDPTGGSAGDRPGATPDRSPDLAWRGPGPRPEWWQRGVVYQVYPRSFADSDGDGVGDLNGITGRLDHLRDLGVDAVWLSPIYPSPGFDLGYDVADYQAVDPIFGTLADLDRMVAAAHERGLGVILDLVLNHSSHRHPWFEASRQSRRGPFANYYIWRDPAGTDAEGGPIPPNNWVSFFGGSAWAWEPARGQFYLHTFLAEQPDLNFREAAVRQAQLDVGRFWLERGIDGFRLDVFNIFYKDADLRSNPELEIDDPNPWNRQRHVHDRNQPELGEFLRDFRAMVDERPNRMTVGELFYGEPNDAAVLATDRHLVFDWALLSAPWEAGALADAIDTREVAFGPKRWPATVMSNHDQPRQATRSAASAGLDPTDVAGRDAIARSMAVLLLGLRGTPFMYQGEEIGLGDAEIPPQEILDPPARLFAAGTWWARDPCRAPIPWDASPNGGFTTARPWMRLAGDTASRNVAAQSADGGSVLATYRSLLRLRRTLPALEVGDFAWVARAEADVLAWRREADESIAIAAVNVSPSPSAVGLPAPPEGRSWRLVFSTGTNRGAALLDARVERLELEPWEGVVAVAS